MTFWSRNRLGLGLDPNDTAGACQQVQRVPCQSAPVQQQGSCAVHVIVPALEQALRHAAPPGRDCCCLGPCLLGCSLCRCTSAALPPSLRGQACRLCGDCRVLLAQALRIFYLPAACSWCSCMTLSESHSDSYCQRVRMPCCCSKQSLCDIACWSLEQPSCNATKLPGQTPQRLGTAYHKMIFSSKLLTAPLFLFRAGAQPACVALSHKMCGTHLGALDLFCSILGRSPVMPRVAHSTVTLAQ